MAIEESRISNVLGVPVPQWIIDQLNRRSTELSRVTKDTDNIRYQGNRTAWIRMVSSVDVVKKSAQDYFKNMGLTISDETSLAKLFILQGGVSIYENREINGSKLFNYRQRNGFSESYNVAGPNETLTYGYRPMPGITNVRVQTQGKLGSIRSADIQLKVWDKNQLDIIDALYFKLGYTMFLEWGHTYYYDNNGVLQESEIQSIDPFSQDVTKEIIANQISNNINKTKGNYDAMLGIVTNFNFTYNQEGGYDCTIKLMALGSLISTIKMNNPRILPDLSKNIVKVLVDTILREAQRQQALENAKNNSQSEDPENINYYPSCLRNKVQNQAIQTFARGQLKEKRLQDYALFGQVNGVTYLFYRSKVNPQGGDWQTSGYSARGGWYCDGEALYIDGKNTDFTNKPYKDILENSQISKVYAPYNDSSLLPVLTSGGQLNTNVGKINLDKPYVSKLINAGKEYLAFNKFKALVPTNVEKYSVSANIQIPTLTVTRTKLGNSGNVNNISAPFNISKTILQGSSVYKVNEVAQIDQQNGITYLLREEPGRDIIAGEESNSTNYIAVVTYAIRGSGGEIHEYAISVKYDGTLNNYESGRNAEKKAFSTYSGEKKDEIQAKIEEALNNTTEPWKVININENEIPGSLNVENRVPKITIVLSKTIKLTIKSKEVPTDKGADGRPLSETVPRSQWKDVDSIYSFNIELRTNDIGIITSLDIKPNSELQRASDAIDQAKQQTDQNTQEVASTDPPEPALKVSDIQASEALKYQSAFEVMVRTLQLYSLDSALNANIEKDKKVLSLDLTQKSKDGKEGTYPNFTKQLFSVGIFSNMLDYLVDEKYELEKICQKYDEEVQKNGITSDKDDMLKLRAIFGFHFGLMGNVTTATDLYKKQCKVDYKSLLKTYIVPYEFNSGIFEGTQVNHPVYIPLGLVVMILNHVCGIYESNGKATFTTPLVYVDYNNITNLCMSNAKHLSTNPYDVLIPFQGTNKDYESIIDPTVLQKGKSGDIEIMPPSGSTESTPLFKIKDKTGDRISSGLPEFKLVTSEKVETFRGRTMNILLSCDYLLKVVSSYSKNNGSGDIYFKEFLEQILFDINKYLGDINLFRLAYSDAGNTAHIVDDQIIPNLEGKYANSETNKSEFPLFASQSIARNLEIRTEISSKLNNTLAISANSSLENQSTLSKNGDSLGIYNLSYKDRFIPYRGELTGNIELPTNTMIESAIQFNKAIETFYMEAKPAESSVSHATNYYIQRMSKIKGQETGTRAAAMIPVNLNFSIDGISGIGMGHAFTISDQLLPYTYDLRNVNPFGEQDNLNTVGFVMVGLDQVIENNQWISNIRASMVYLKKRQDFESDIIKKLEKSDLGLESEESEEGISGGGSGGSGGNSKKCPSCEELKAKYEADPGCSRRQPGSAIPSYTYNSLQNMVYKEDNSTSSPNKNSGGIKKPIGVVIHHSAGTLQSDITIMKRSGGEKPVSYHTIIGRDGTRYNFVPETDKAWHAGCSYFKHPNLPGGFVCNDVNSYFLGIAFVGAPNYKGTGGTDTINAEEIDSAAKWIVDKIKKYNMPRDLSTITTHGNVACGRKDDAVRSVENAIKARIKQLL